MKYSIPFVPSSGGFQWVADSVWKVEHAFERAHVEGQTQENTAQRIFFILALIACMFAVLMIFAVKAALFSGVDGVTGAPVSPGARSELVDRNGALLAADGENFILYVDPTDMMASDRPLVKRALIQLLPDVSLETIDKALRGDGRARVAGWLKPSDRARILNYGLPGLIFEPVRVRTYPLGITGASYIGATERGGKGVAGAERALNDDIDLSIAAHGGVPVELAMDLRVQGALENELRAAAVDQQAQAAIGIVTNVRTGEILGMASWPEYDPNRAGSFSENEKKNRAAAAVYEMGSIFKVISVAIGLETGTASINSVFDARAPFKIGSRKISDYHAENRVMTLEDVFIHSSNIGVSQLAESVGIDTMTRFYDNLGLFRAADTELYESARPIIAKKWTASTLASTSFGHAMSISPLAYAQAFGAVANGGYLRPLTVRKHQPGQVLDGARVFSANTSRQMLDLMRINGIRGTGTRANAPGLRVGGKTGSAERVVDGRYLRSSLFSSYVAVFPTDGAIEDDRYMVLIMVDDPKGSKASSGLRTGGFVAAPVAGRVIDRIAPFVGVARKEDKFTQAEWDKAPVVAEVQSGAQSVPTPVAAVAPLPVSGGQ
jgi:cell division protein FtsI (penicillin-binding protein 3)